MERDERESGLREILNFGHTFGHALEAITGYRRFLHGEAIGWGMYAATLLGAATGRIGEAEVARIMRLVARVGPLPSIGKIDAARIAADFGGGQEITRRRGSLGAAAPNWKSAEGRSASLEADCSHDFRIAGTCHEGSGLKTACRL